MAGIITDKEEFSDIIIKFLLDSLMNRGIDIKNEEFQEILLKMEKCNIKPYMIHAYINMDSKTKQKYKIFKKVFEKNASGNSTVVITPVKKEKEKISKDKESLIKTIVKKSLKLIKSHKNRYGQLISEETVDKIIEKSIKETI